MNLASTRASPTKTSPSSRADRKRAAAEHKAIEAELFAEELNYFGPMADTTPNAKQQWESRYGGDEYLYGTEPNDFLRSAVADLPAGSALCIADGEGRNGVYLATLGHEVTSVDLTESGMAKAAQLPAAHDVRLSTVVADLADFDFGVNQWDLIVSIFAYTPPPVPELTMTLDDLRTELVDLQILHGSETVRSVVEGPGHTGDGAVVQVIPAPKAS